MNRGRAFIWNGLKGEAYVKGRNFELKGIERDIFLTTGMKGGQNAKSLKKTMHGRTGVGVNCIATIDGLLIG